MSAWNQIDEGYESSETIRLSVDDEPDWDDPNFRIDRLGEEVAFEFANIPVFAIDTWVTRKVDRSDPCLTLVLLNYWDDHGVSVDLELRQAKALRDQLESAISIMEG